MSKLDIDHLLATRRWCYVIPLCQDAKALGGYMPSVAIEGVPGHIPMSGQGEHAAPWIWGPTLKDAQATATHMNERLGITPEVATQIEASTFKGPKHSDQPEDED